MLFRVRQRAFGARAPVRMVMPAPKANFGVSALTGKSASGACRSRCDLVGGGLRARVGVPAGVDNPRPGRHVILHPYQAANLGKSGLSVGYFDTELEAAHAYDRAAIGIYLSPMKLNFPEEMYEDQTVCESHRGRGVIYDVMFK